MYHRSENGSAKSTKQLGRETIPASELTACALNSVRGAYSTRFKLRYFEKGNTQMAIEDYLEPEVVVAVALTAAVTSPTVRGLLRRGAVYGMAGLMVAGDAVTTMARGVGRGAQRMAATAGEIIHENGDRPDRREQTNNAARARRRPQAVHHEETSSEGAHEPRE